jgi:ankyrin
MAKFCVFSKQHEMLEARMRVFCMTDDKEEKTLEHQEHFHEVAKSRDVEVMEGKTHHLEFYGNLFPVTKSGEQLSHKFHAFRENRLPFTVRVKDPNSEPLGRISFFIEPKRERGEAQQQAICNLNINLPEDISPEAAHHTDQDLLAIQAKYSFLREAGYGKFDTIHRADLRVSDISNLLGSDWIKLARELDVEDQDINLIISEYPDNVGQQAMVMLRLWLNTEGNKATGNALEKALKQCDRQDIVNKCMFNVEQVTDNFEKRVAENELEDQSGFAAFKEDLAPTNNGGVAGTKALLRDYSIHVNVDESEHRESPRDGSFDLTQERLTGVNEEVTVRSEATTNNGRSEGVEGLRSVLQDNKQEEATSVYEREEHKYVAEEKEFAASFHKEQMSQNLISQSQTQELSQDANNVVTERSEARQEFLHEDMKKMSLEEKTTMRIADEGGRMAEVTSESRMEEQHQAREEYNNERTETRQTQMEQREDGTTLILTEAKAESKQAFSSQSQDTRRFEHTETTVTGAETSADEAVNLRTGAKDTTSEHGFEEQIPAPEFGEDGLSAGKPEADSSTKIQQQ